MTGSKRDKIIEELYRSLLQNYQKDLEETMTGSKCIFYSVDLLYYQLLKLGLKGGWSHIDYTKWLKTKKATINPKNNDDNCFQYALTDALNYQNIKKDPQRISKIKPFIDQYNWKEKKFPAHSKDWKKLELSNKTIVLNIFCAIQYLHTNQNIISCVKIK